MLPGRYIAMYLIFIWKNKYKNATYGTLRYEIFSILLFLPPYDISMPFSNNVELFFVKTID